jgi:DNA-binding sugar fermentation-stimulating protein
MAKQVLSGKGKGKKKLEQAFEGNAFVFIDIALPEQLTERMIMKEQVDLVFNKRNLCYSLLHSVSLYRR